MAYIVACTKFELNQLRLSANNRRWGSKSQQLPLVAMIVYYKLINFPLHFHVTLVRVLYHGMMYDRTGGIIKDCIMH